MASTARKMDILPGVSDYLGPAHVVSTGPSEIEVALEGGEVVKARMAMAFSYTPEPSDVMLVIGKGEVFYAIGVLSGTGKATLSFPGDVEVRAEGGTLRLLGDQGVSIGGPLLEMTVEKVRVMATEITEKCATFYQRVSALLSVRAERSHTVVDETSFTKAKSAAILTEETVTVNGKQIHLG